MQCTIGEMRFDSVPNGVGNADFGNFSITWEGRTDVGWARPYRAHPTPILPRLIEKLRILFA